MTKEQIREKRREIDRWDFDQRQILLESHSEERWLRQKELYADCEAITGHEWYDLPHNGFNRHDYNGNWPQDCLWCGKSRSFAKPELTEE